MATASETGISDFFDLVELPANGPAYLAVAIPNARFRSLPGFPQAALPGSGRIASGRGLTSEDCRRSCLGEGIELVSCCDWGDRELVRATENDMGPAALAPRPLNGFTDEQLRGRDQWNRLHATFDWRPRPAGRHSLLDWIAVDDAYGGAGRLAPADFVMIGRRQAGDEGAIAIGDSNGCAAGNGADAAKLAAVLELIERDATGRWWYGCRRRPPLEIGTIAGVDPMRDWLSTRQRRTWLFDITSDLKIPVLAAASAERDGEDVALGFAARPDGHLAAIAALTEMLQMEVSIIGARELGLQTGDWADWRSSVRMIVAPLDAALELAPIRPSWSAPKSGLSHTLEVCCRKGIDLWFVNMTRLTIGTPVYRALSSELCHFKPRFGRRRLTAPDGGPVETPAGVPADRPLLLI
jgi:ribosomal protein S12 methylthiotransferase accessory factor